MDKLPEIKYVGRPYSKLDAKDVVPTLSGDYNHLVNAINTLIEYSVDNYIILINDDSSNSFEIGSSTTYLAYKIILTIERGSDNQLWHIDIYNTGSTWVISSITYNGVDVGLTIPSVSISNGTVYLDTVLSATGEAATIKYKLIQRI